MVANIVKAVLGAALVASLGSAAALAQRTVPEPYQAPYTYGGTTANPDGGSSSAPGAYGSPGYGVATRGPDGQICVTTPGLLGNPQYGTTTTCYSDGTVLPRGNTEGSSEDTSRR